MNRTAFYAILVVLVLGIIYVLKTAEHPPDTGMTQTPREYIEQLERNKADRRTGKQVNGEPDASKATEGSSKTGLEAQR